MVYLLSWLLELFNLFTLKFLEEFMKSLNKEMSGISYYTETAFALKQKLFIRMNWKYFYKYYRIFYFNMQLDMQSKHFFNKLHDFLFKKIFFSCFFSCFHDFEKSKFQF